MLHVLTELSETSTDQEIKDMNLTNFSDIPGTAEAATRLQNLQMKVNEPLVMYNARYQAIRQVAFGFQPTKQYNRTAIVEYAKKLPQITKGKLLRKISKKTGRCLDDTFKQAREIDRENSFVDAASGRCNEQIRTKAETQTNEIDDSFQDYDIDAVSTRSTNRSSNRSFNRSFDRSSSRNSSYNSSFNSRPNFRSSNGYSSDNNSRHHFNKDDSQNKGYQQNNRFEQRNNCFQNRYSNNQDRNRFENRR